MDEALIAELVRERFGAGIPWRERTNRPRVASPPEDDLTKARRRRVLNEAMSDSPQADAGRQRTA